jgi:hypothetical protein
MNTIDYDLVKKITEKQKKISWREKKISRVKGYAKKDRAVASSTANQANKTRKQAPAADSALDSKLGGWDFVVAVGHKLQPSHTENEENLQIRPQFRRVKWAGYFLNQNPEDKCFKWSSQKIRTTTRNRVQSR